jgi:hypothetical protein
MSMRADLLNLPNEHFKPLLQGRLPTPLEKASIVEDLVREQVALQIFENDTYKVLVGHAPPFIRLTVKRHDNQPCESWKDLQTIKNQLVGPEFEAAELFPAESRLVDAGNEYHLWVHADPSFRFPFGFQCSRAVPEHPLVHPR